MVYPQAILRALRKGFVQEEHLYSETIGSNWSYMVYYPYSYNTDKKRRYSVMYILHGLGDDYQSWLSKTHIKEMLDAAITENIIEETIVIFPSGYSSWYADSEYMSMRSAFINDLFPYVETNFRVIHDRSKRYIGGNSMGGHGALVLSLSKPDYFSKAFLFSPATTRLGEPPPDALRTILKLKYDSKPFTNTHKAISDAGKLVFSKYSLEELFGDPFVQELWDKYSYHEPLKSYVKQNNEIDYFITVGTKDLLTPAEDTRALVENLKNNNIKCIYSEIKEEAHTWGFWDYSFKKALVFLSPMYKGK